MKSAGLFFRHFFFPPPHGPDLHTCAHSTLCCVSELLTSQGRARVYRGRGTLRSLSRKRWRTSGVPKSTFLGGDLWAPDVPCPLTLSPLPSLFCMLTRAVQPYRPVLRVRPVRERRPGRRGARVRGRGGKSHDCRRAWWMQSDTRHPRWLRLFEHFADMAKVAEEYEEDYEN